jgi:hypothetical protein
MLSKIFNKSVNHLFINKIEISPEVERVPKLEYYITIY